MAKEAERLLADTGWLPEPLRIAAVDDAAVETTEADDDGEALPEFLAGDDEGGGSRRAAGDCGRIARVRGGFGRPAPFSSFNRTHSPAFAPGIFVSGDRHD